MIASFVLATMLANTPLDSADLSRSIQRLADSLQAEIGVAFYDLETGRGFTFNECLMLHAASTMKVPVMIEIFRQAEAGNFQLDDSLLVNNEFKSIVDGSIYSMDMGDDSDDAIYKMIGRRMTIRQLVEQMITVSSNLATNILIDRVDARNVMKTLQSLGIQRMQVLRGVEDTKAFNLGLNNRTDAYDMMLTMRAIAEAKAASPASCAEMIEILKRQTLREKIPAGLPKGIMVANKTGDITNIDHDAAIVFPPHRRPYVLAILTHKIADHQAAEKAIAEFSRLIGEYFIARSR